MGSAGRGEACYGLITGVLPLFLEKAFGMHISSHFYSSKGDVQALFIELPCVGECGIFTVRVEMPRDLLP